MTVWTIGHSNHKGEALLGLLEQYEISLLVDVRSRPRSRWPQFNQRALRPSVEERGISYAWLPALGGIPEELSLRLPNGDADFDAIRASTGYASALAEVITQTSRHRVALMCSEGNPEDCHRLSTLSPDLTERGLEVLHILRDGSLMGQLV